MKNHNLLSLVFVGLVLAGCAKDQTVAEYDQKQADLNAARQMPAVGKWSGTLTASDGSTVGSVSINLQNTPSPTTASDNSSSEQSILTGVVELPNIPNTEAKITAATFDPDQSTLSATITAQDDSGVSQNLNLTGTINGDTMTGQIKAEDYTTMNFTATRGATATGQNLVVTSLRGKFQNMGYSSGSINLGGLCSIMVQEQAALPGQQTVGPPPAGRSINTPTPDPGTACEVTATMSLVQQSPNEGANFLNVFTNDRSVEVDINYYSILSVDSSTGVVTTSPLPIGSVQFPLTTWFLDSNQLSSTATISGATNRLTCSAETFSSGQGWSCEIVQSGVSFSTDFDPSQMTSN